jgi:hypothetical protein
LGDLTQEETGRTNTAAGQREHLRPLKTQKRNNTAAQLQGREEPASQEGRDESTRWGSYTKWFEIPKIELAAFWDPRALPSRGSSKD